MQEYTRICDDDIIEIMLAHNTRKQLWTTLSFHMYNECADTCLVYVKYIGCAYGHYAEIPILNTVGLECIGYPVNTHGAKKVLSKAIDILDRVEIL